MVRDENGEIYTVRYDAVNAMLLNEFLKEHRKVQDLEKGMAALTAQLKEQAAQIQKVSAHLEMSKPATSVVLNHPIKFQWITTCSRSQRPRPQLYNYSLIP